jgi:hypothetical protein
MPYLQSKTRDIHQGQNTFGDSLFNKVGDFMRREAGATLMAIGRRPLLSATTAVSFVVPFPRLVFFPILSPLF